MSTKMGLPQSEMPPGVMRKEAVFAFEFAWNRDYDGPAAGTGTVKDHSQSEKDCT